MLFLRFYWLHRNMQTVKSKLRMCSTITYRMDYLKSDSDHKRIYIDGRYRSSFYNYVHNDYIELYWIHFVLTAWIRVPYRRFPSVSIVNLISGTLTYTACWYKVISYSFNNNCPLLFYFKSHICVSQCWSFNVGDWRKHVWDNAFYIFGGYEFCTSGHVNM